MPEIRLVDFVLLECDFSVWTSDPDTETDGELEPEESGTAGPQDEVFDYPEGDFLHLDVGSSEFEDLYVVVITASIQGQDFPFRMRLVVGSRFFVAADESGPRPTLEEAEGTLVWLSYPYLRETVSAISGRSPLPPYVLPAITKLPHPSATQTE